MVGTFRNARPFGVCHEVPLTILKKYATREVFWIMNPVAHIPAQKDGALRSAPWVKRSFELAGMEMSS